MDKQNKQFGFTIVELLVAMFLLVILLGLSAMVFRHAVEAQRVAAATAEIMQKYNAVTYQLKTDFQKMDKSAEICIAWVPGIDTNGDNTVDIFTRMDRIYFFVTGSGNDYKSYNLWPTASQPTGMILIGNSARICYMLAGDGNGRKAANQPADERMLGRSQHLFTGETELEPPGNPSGHTAGTPITFPDPAAFTSEQNNYYESDTITAANWRDIPTWTPPTVSEKSNMVEQSIDIDVYPPTGGTDRGIQINTASALNLQSLLAQGVGEFKIQSWFEAEMRWIPEVDPNGDGNLSDTDFVPNGTGVDAVSVPGILYPGKFYSLPGYENVYGPYPLANLNQANFSSIPGLGTALKFTFTLYDSKGVFPQGKTFTYIVDL